MNKRIYSDVEQERLRVLNTLLCPHIEEILEELGAGLNRIGRKFAGPCPIHQGDNTNGFAIYPEGDTNPGFWECRTRGCGLNFGPRKGPTLVGFVWASLSRDRLGWTPGDAKDKRVGFADVIKWCCDYLKIDFSEIKVDLSAARRNKFYQRVHSFQDFQNQGAEPLCGFNQLADLLSMPSAYFIRRGFSEAVLNRFSVGDYKPTRGPMAGRAVIPFLRDSDKAVMGVIGRRIDDMSLPCSTTGEARYYVDSSNGFSDKDWLYGLWLAKPFIQATRCVVVCEGAADAWRASMVGVDNVVALCGSELSNSQELALGQLSVSQIIVATDADTAGDAAFERIREGCGFARVHRFRPDIGDIAETPIEVLKATLPSFVKARSR